MTTKTIRERLLATTIIAGAASFALASQAAAQGSAPVAQPPTAGTPGTPAGVAFGPETQTVPSTNANGAPTQVQAVVVTGSRIPQPNLRSSSPVSVVSNQEIKLEGATDAANVVSQLPQMVATGTDINNTPDPLSSSGGFTTVDLRGLGDVRTLVLQDGRRLMPGDPTLGGEAPDIDQIPSQLIDRIEVVTGGASAVYGSDAIAGVVNFILKHNFQGVQFDIQGGFAQDSNNNAQQQGMLAAAGDPIPGAAVDGENFIASLVLGSNMADGRGNVTGYLSYRHQDPVIQGNRDYSACESTATPSCTGSSNSNFFQDNIGGNVYSVLGAAPNNTFVPFGTSTAIFPPTAFNSNPYEYLSRGDERYQAGFLGHYQVKPWADFYTDFTFMDDRTAINIAPTAAFRGPFYPVNCDNPLLSAQQVDAICTSNGLGPTDFASLTLGRRNVEGGPREYRYEHLSYRGVFGVRGDIVDGWHYDAYAQFGYTKYNYAEENDFSQAKITNALDVVTGPNGTPVCAIGDPCVPYNIFSDGGVTQAALNYIGEGTLQTGDTQEQVVSLNITGDLGKYGIQSPFASSGVGVNIGTEYRRESLVYTPDAASQSGDVTGAGTAFPSVNGQFDVYELFGELRVPLVQDRPFVRDLTFDGAYRFSEYSSSGDIDAYKFGLEYAPTQDIRFRGSFQRAVRAPNVNELFTPVTVTNGSYSDPCANDIVNGVPASATLAQCMHTGVTAAEYGNGGSTDRIQQCPADQCGVDEGGNANLKPEKSNTTSLGFVVTPRWLRGFDASLDYYRIDVKNAISVIPANISMQQCLTTGDPTFCNLIHRTATGELVSTTGFIDEFNINAGALKTAGFDLEVNYRLNLDDVGLHNMGRLAANFAANYTQHFIDVPVPGLGGYDCAGYFGVSCGTARPRAQGKLRLTYFSPWKFQVSAQWRYIGSMRLDTNQDNPLLSNGSIDTYDARLASVSYFDISGLYTLRDNLTLRAGVNNLFDKDPRQIAGNAVVPSGAPNTYPIYDLLGRQFFFGLTADF